MALATSDISDRLLENNVQSCVCSLLQVRMFCKGLQAPSEGVPVYEREGPPPYVEGAPPIGERVKQRKLQGES